MAPPRGNFSYRGGGRGRGGGGGRGHPFIPHQRSFGPPRGGHRSGFQPRFQEAQPGVTTHENITLKELKEGRLNERLVKIVEYLSSSIEGKVKNENACISLRVSARYEEENEQPVRREEQVVRGEPLNSDTVLEALQNALAKHLEKKKKLTEELPGKMEAVRELQGTSDVEAGENIEEEEDGEEEENGIEEENTDPESDVQSEEMNDQETTITTPNKPVETVKNESKKKKRSKSENLDNSNAEDLVGAKKQKRDGTLQKALVSTAVDSSEKLNGSQNSNVQTPAVKNKKMKNRNSLSAGTPSNEKTPNINKDAADASINSSKKKKRKSKQLQESNDYLPLSV